MFRTWMTWLLLSMSVAVAQTSTPSPSQLAPDSEQLADHLHDSPPPNRLAVSPPSSPTVPGSVASDSDLPDAPSSTLAAQQDVVVAGKAALKASGKDQKSCNLVSSVRMIYFNPKNADEPRPRCSQLVYPYQQFLSTNIAIPLSWKEKGYLAAHYTSDPTSIGVIVGIAAINIAADSHTAYGPGFEGFGKLAGISLLQNATAEFFGTFAVPSLMHQDPRYYRRPDKPVVRRVLYAISRSYVSRSDEGKTIPNYGTLSAYPIVAELGNLYVPGIESDGESTAERILTGLALDPVNNLVNEFLPDLAKRIHVRIILVQHIMNNLATSNSGTM